MAYILVIDDDSGLRAGIAAALSRVGHEVDQAGTGREAMALLESRAPDLVVTDINMPDMDGIEVILELGDRERPIPIIAISGGGYMPKELLLENAGMLGAVETMPKPFELPDLLALVDRLLTGGESM